MTLTKEQHNIICELLLDTIYWCNDDDDDEYTESDYQQYLGHALSNAETILKILRGVK